MKEWSYLPSKVISGGQTGADRAGLDAALHFSIPHGGWCPKGRRSEDGPISKRYKLQETEESGYVMRTIFNAEEADGTIIFAYNPNSPGTRCTVQALDEADRPYILLDLNGVPIEEAITYVVDFIRRFQVEVLNIAGNRESSAPGITDQVRRILLEAFSKKVERGGSGNTQIRDGQGSGDAPRRASTPNWGGGFRPKHS